MASDHVDSIFSYSGAVLQFKRRDFRQKPADRILTRTTKFANFVTKP
jgi:hypothetical protein